jgi:branched-chain amino acid transport system substrate-binding protein
LRVPRLRSQTLALAACCVLLAACAFPGSVKTTVKIGLSAPFEGLYRDLGYEVLNAVRLAVRQRNEAGGVGGRYLVEQVALNDFNEADEAVRQAHEMAVDPAIVGVLGGWSPQAARAAAPEYERLGLAFLAPQAEWDILASEAAHAATSKVKPGAALVLYSPDPADAELAQAFAEAYVVQGGSIAGVQIPGDDNWVQRLLHVGTRFPDVVFMAGNALTAASWIVAFREAGFEGMLVGGPELGSTVVVDIAGEASEGVLFVSPFPPFDGDSELVNGYQELSGGVAPGPAAGWAYKAANRLLDTMALASQVQGRSLRAAVQETLPTQSGDSYHVYLYVIRSGNLFTVYQPPSARH